MKKFQCSIISAMKNVFLINLAHTYLLTAYHVSSPVTRYERKSDE